MYFYSKVLELTLLSSIFVISIYLMTGLTGLFSVGQGAFISIGAYVAALSHLRLHTPFVLSTFLAILAGVVCGILIGLPTLRLRKDYFLLITLGLGEMVRGILIRTAQFTGGAMGIAGIPKLVGLPLIAISTGVILFLVWNLKRSNFGRVCIAIRNDELAAASLGINVYRHKMIVFIISAAITSYGGALFAFNILFIEPNLFDWLESAKLIVIVFVGGLDSLSGTFITSLLYYSFGELFRFANVWRDVILAALVIIVVIFRHKGLFATWELSFKWFASIPAYLFSRKNGKNIKN